MATTANSIITPQTCKSGSPTNGFTNANGTAAITVYTPAADFEIISAINVYSTDTSTGTITLNKVISGTTYPLVTTTIPIQAGNITGTPPVNLLSAAIFPSLPVDQNGNRYLLVNTGETLTCAMSVAPTSGKVFTVVPLNAQGF